MALQGSAASRSILSDLHRQGCTASERVVCRPVVRPPVEREASSIEVVRMVWCEQCGAADWEVV